jgi:GNAT superfamily N-acetyltransferase
MPRRAWEVLREEGLRSLWFHILGETVYRRVVLLERPLGEPIPEAAAATAVEISLLKAGEAEEYAAFHPGLEAAEVRERLARGGRCFLSRHQGSIVNACWTAEGPVWIDYLGCGMELARDEVYVYNNYTDPRFRGRNISAVRAAVMLRHFRELGYRRMIAVVVPENKAAFRSPDKAGYRPIGAIGCIRIGPWRKAWMPVWHRRSRGESR